MLYIYIIYTVYCGGTHTYIYIYIFYIYYMRAAAKQLKLNPQYNKTKDKNNK
jgi:hypothetical protein